MGTTHEKVGRPSEGGSVLVCGVVRWIGRGESASHKNRIFASALAPRTQLYLTGRGELTRAVLSEVGTCSGARCSVTSAQAQEEVGSLRAPASTCVLDITFFQHLRLWLRGLWRS